jgi:nuclear transport factor 2 (NTF2) superfamily protein
MTLESSQAQAGRNPTTPEEARAFVKHVESLFMPWNVEALVAGFTQDCKVHFGTVELRGRQALREFFVARSAKQKNYRLNKRLCSLMRDTLANVWEGEWEDAETGIAMKGFGVEVWVMRDGKIARWEAAFNAGPAARAGSLSDLL